LPLIKEPPAKLLFEKEVTSHEFTEIICGMDANVNISRSKRDLYLMKHGKKLFKTHPLKKKNKIKLFFRNLYKRKIDHNMDYANFERILRELNTDVYVPSQEEIDAMLTPVKLDKTLQEKIDAMLTPVKEVKVLSQEEADSILTSIKKDDKLKDA